MAQLENDDRFQTCAVGINKENLISFCMMFKTDEVKCVVAAAMKFQKNVVRKWNPDVDDVLKHNYMGFSDCEEESTSPTGALILDLCQKWPFAYVSSHQICDSEVGYQIS